MSPINPQNFLTTLPSEILYKIGASSESRKARIEIEDGSFTEAKIFSIVLCAHGREEPTLADTFDKAQPILGAKFLEDFDLRLNPELHELEPARHQGFAFSAKY